jgi:uncharacterized membrane protein
MSDNKPPQNSSESPADVSLPKEIDSIVSRMPPRDSGQVREYIQRTIRHSFQGPFPPPHMLEDYERFHPGFLGELMARAKAAQDHQECMDRDVLLVQRRYMTRGQLIAAGIAILTLATAFFCITEKAYATAALFGIASLTPILGHFLKNPFHSPPSQPEQLQHTSEKGKRRKK